MNEFILNNIKSIDHLGLLQHKSNCMVGLKVNGPTKVDGRFTLANHNSLFRPLRLVATRSLTCCQKKVLSVKYPTTKIIIR